MALNLITLPPDLCRRCQSFGSTMAESYARGKSPKSLAFSSHGMEKNIDGLGQAKAAECAVALWLDYPIDRIHWRDGADLGCDLEIGPHQIDVKRSHENSQWLIWPINKNIIFSSKRFNLLVFVRGTIPVFEINGWIRKREFFKHKQIAPLGHKLTQGTWFIDKDELCPMDGLLMLLEQESAA